MVTRYLSVYDLPGSIQIARVIAPHVLRHVYLLPVLPSAQSGGVVVERLEQTSPSGGYQEL